MVEKFRIKAISTSAESLLEKSKNTKGMIVKEIKRNPLILEYTVLRPRFAPKNFLQFVTKDAIMISIKKELAPLIMGKDYIVEVNNE